MHRTTIPFKDQSFDVFRSEDGTVSKYVHEDGSETAIKIVKSTQNVLNPLTREIETHTSDRNKYSIFISSSVGCFLKCKFCHLTLKEAQYSKLEAEQVLMNVKEALLDALTFNPDIATKYVKLSWMGMGDALNKPFMVYDVSLALLDWIMEHGFAAGLDGVDLSTVMPKLKNKDWIAIYHDLENKLSTYPRNPVYDMDNVEYSNATGYSQRNLFRLFYSIESAIQSCRDVVVPNTMPLDEAIPLLLEYDKQGKYPVIFHHLLVDGLNDSPAELDALITMMSNHFPDNELRILRYNFCAKSSYKESEKFLEQIRKLSDSLNFIKVQISPGTEVSAACGQFIVKDFIRSGKAGTK